MNIIIRKAKLEELSVIQDLNHDLFISDSKNDTLLDLEWSYKEGSKYFQRRISGEKGICFVAKLNGEVVGYLAGAMSGLEPWRKESRAELENMYVKDEYRGKGIGTKLIEEFTRWARENGAQHIFLSVYSKNSSAQKFYERNKFTTTNLFMEKET